MDKCYFLKEVVFVDSWAFLIFDGVIMLILKLGRIRMLLTMIFQLKCDFNFEIVLNHKGRSGKIRQCIVVLSLCLLFYENIVQPTWQPTS